MATKLTAHFTLEELTRSDKANELGLDNTPPNSVLANLLSLAEMLERVRKVVGKPVTVRSGYRSPEVNKAVGGSATSAHMKGMAADIYVKGMDCKAVALLLAPLVGEFGIDQLIYEQTWVHVGISYTPRGQIKTRIVVNGKDTYVGGIV